VRVSLLTAGALLGAALLGGCATARPAPPAAASGTAMSVESADPRLAAALLAERLAPSAEAHLQVAREYVRLGILDFAHRRVERALARDPGCAAAHELMARIWRDWRQPQVALGHAHRAFHFAPASASAQNTLGTILDALGEVDGARAAYRQAFSLDPGAGWALSNLCYLEFRQGRFVEAKQQCKAALQVTPRLAAAHNNLALAHAGSGDLAGASVAFAGAGDDASAHYNLGIVHLAAGRYDDAVRAFEAAIEARPDFTAAKSRAHAAKMQALGAGDRKQP